MFWARFTSERANGRMCNSGLTVPLPANKAASISPVPMPETPCLYGLEGGDISALDLGPPSVSK